MAATPTVSLRISPELRKLYADYRHAAAVLSVPEVTAGDEDPRPGEETEKTPDPARLVSEPELSWMPIKLRRDGVRPLRAEAVPMLHLEGADSAGGVHAAAFFLCRDGAVLGALSYEPSTASGAWSVHSAMSLTGADGSSTDLFGTHDPERGFSAGACRAARHAARDFFKAMAVSLGLSATKAEG
ncbi:MAG: hypothetical protein AAF526_01165 [Pseudomonadota bacterium]